MVQFKGLTPEGLLPETARDDVLVDVDERIAPVNKRVDDGLATKSDTGHAHTTADVTGLDTALSGKAPATHTHAYADITGKPTAFTPATHIHSTTDVTGLDTALADKADKTHTHTTAQVDGLSAALADAGKVQSVLGKTGAITAQDFIDAGVGGVPAGAIDKQAVQADYVEVLESQSPLSGVQIVKTGADEALQVVAHSPTGQYVAHTIKGTKAGSGRDDYRIVGDIYTGRLPNKVSTYTNLTTSGTFTATAEQFGFTTQVGATFEIPVNVPFRGAEVRLHPYKDNRGGVWRITFANRSTDVSTYSPASASEVNGFMVSAPGTLPGRYILKGEFLGADPANPPTGGTARGWLARTPAADGSTTTYPGTYDLISTPDGSQGWPLTTKQGVESNREFAWWFRPAGTTVTAQWVPHHGVASAFQAEAPRFYDGDKEINVFRMTTGQHLDLTGPFKLVQHVYGRIPNHSATENLIEVWTTTTIHPSGRMTIEGRIKVLKDLEVTKAYVIMDPVAAPLFDTVVSSWGNTYPNTSPQLGTNTWLPESDIGSSYLFLSSTSPNAAAAFRYNNPVETIRRGGANKASADRRAWLEHRAGGEILKHYQRLWDTDSVVPVGTVLCFSGDYMHTETPNAYGQMAR